jgi:hemoglobin/transferrin/lactoferrin receptor protein
VEAIHNDVISSAFSEDIMTNAQSTASTRYPDNGSTLTSLASYISFKNSWTKKVTFSLGARYNYSVLTASFKDTSFIKLPFTKIKNNNDAITGNAGVNFHPNKRWNIQLAISSAFRSPNVDDVGKVFAKNDYVLVPNEKLTPEKAYNAEVGITRAFGKEDLVINIVGFYTLLEDAIVRNFYTINGEDSLSYDGETFQIQTNMNENQAVVYGMSLQLKAKLSNELILKSSLNYTRGRNVTANVPLGHIPPVYGRTDLILRSAPLTVAFYAKYQFDKLFIDYSPSGEDNENQAAKDENGAIFGTPAWQTLNLRAEMQLSKSFSLQVALENMLDVHYRPFASGLSGAGRNFIFTLRANL